MAAKTWYLTHGIASNTHQQLSETSLGSNQTTSPNYGWTVGIIAPTQYAAADAQTEIGGFSVTEPSSGIVTTAGAGNCWRTSVPLTGTFDTGTWQIDGAAIAVSVGAGQDGRIKVRVFRSVNLDGSSATELTTASQTGSTITNLTTFAQQTSTASFSIDTFSVSNEYIFIQMIWEITGAASGHGASIADIIFRVGPTASLVISANFTTTSAQTDVFEPVTVVSTSTNAFQIAWANPTDAVGADGEFAAYNSTVLAVDEESENLDATDFAWSVPTTATIDGIKVEYDRYSDTASGIADVLIQLIVGGTATGNNNSAAALWPTTHTIATFGSSSDLWGLTPTPADVNGSTFGVRLRCKNTTGAGEIANVDQVRITVYYTDVTGNKFMLVGVGP